VSSPLSKNILLFGLVETAIHQANPVPIRGAFRDRHGRWVRDAMDVKRRSANILRGRTAYLRTAKSCGPVVQHFFRSPKIEENAQEPTAYEICAEKERGSPE
jgi:hypothetical protein